MRYRQRSTGSRIPDCRVRGETKTWTKVAEQIFLVDNFSNENPTVHVRSASMDHSRLRNRRKHWYTRIEFTSSRSSSSSMRFRFGPTSTSRNSGRFGSREPNAKRVHFTSDQWWREVRSPAKRLRASSQKLRFNVLLGRVTRVQTSSGGAEISVNKIKLYLTLITIDYTDLKKKKTNRNATFELRGARNPIAPITCSRVHKQNDIHCNISCRTWK
jgi:hypothetical protein